MDLGIKEIERTLLKKEKEFDAVHPQTRLIVRNCSNAIKALHSKNIKEAKKSLSEAEKSIVALTSSFTNFENHLNHVLQEYAEALIVLSVVEKKSIPSFSELKVPAEVYLTGLLDAIGEIKREMYESLRQGDKKTAETLFKLMEDAFDQLLPLRFSNAILPDFRRKQDVARHQIEQARGELL